jgi:lactate permease
MWQQVYDPFGNSALSTIAAAIPVVTLLVLIATGAVRTHLAALIALAVAIVIAVVLFTMPAGLAIRASILGAVIGFFPIGWIVLNVIFMYRLTVATGAFATLQQAIGGVTPDRRLQLLLIAFAFGAFFEGASGFGTPVAVTAAILIGLGFSPLAASGLSLIANTAPVAYGALGTPIAGLASVTGLDPYLLGAMVGRQLPILMGAANSSGGVMGKMIDAQSIVVASTATNWFGHEGSILRYVFFHSIALACLVGVLVMLQAYVFPSMIVR